MVSVLSTVCSFCCVGEINIGHACNYESYSNSWHFATHGLIHGQEACALLWQHLHVKQITMSLQRVLAVSSGQGMQQAWLQPTTISCIFWSSTLTFRVASCSLNFLLLDCTCMMHGGHVGCCSLLLHAAARLTGDASSLPLVPQATCTVKQQHRVQACTVPWAAPSQGCGRTRLCGAHVPT